MTLNINGALLEVINDTIKHGALNSGVLGTGDKRDWRTDQVGVSIRGDESSRYVLLRVAVLPPHGYPADRAAVYLQVDRDTGDWVYSTADAFDAGLDYRTHANRAVAARTA
jgi:hypothetical protein